MDLFHQLVVNLENWKLFIDFHEKTFLSSFNLSKMSSENIGLKFLLIGKVTDLNNFHFLHSWI